MKVTRAKFILGKFTDQVMCNGFKGRDYAKLTQKMKKWLGLTDATKYANNLRLIAKAELKSAIAMRKMKLHGKFLAKTICFAVCKTM